MKGSHHWHGGHLWRSSRKKGDQGIDQLWRGAITDTVVRWEERLQETMEEMNGDWGVATPVRVMVGNIAILGSIRSFVGCWASSESGALVGDRSQELVWVN